MSKDKLAKVESFAALAPADGMDPVEIIEINLGGELSPDLLTRVKMPSSGSVVWEVPNIEGDIDPEKDITGVIVGIAPKRVCFEKSYDESEGGEQPICFSDDGVYGVGSDKFQGRPCKGCPYDQFGTAPNGRGKKCQERRIVLMLKPDSFLPLLVDLSVMSLKPLKKYLADLSGMRKLFFQVVTAFKLEKAENKDGKQYSRLVVSFVQDLDDEQKAAAQKMWKQLSGDFMTRVTATDEAATDDDIEEPDF